MMATRKLLQYLFQFHEGPIKTHITSLSLKAKPLSFNSMKVRLKPEALSQVERHKQSFNSMKVRLKLCSI